MLRLFIIFLLTIPCSAQILRGIVGASSAVAAGPLVHANDCTGGNSNPTQCTFGSNTVTGNAIAGCVLWTMGPGGSGRSLSSVAISAGSATFTVDVASKSTVTNTAHYGEMGTECFYAANITGGTTPTITATFDSVPDNTSIVWAVEVSGAGVATTKDKSGAGNGATDPDTIGTFTPTVNGTFGVAVVITDDNFGGGNAFTAGTGWTIFQNTGGGSNDRAGEYKAIADTALQTATFTRGGNATWVGSYISLKP